MKLNRLRTMSASEIAHRLREKIRRKADKLQYRGARLEKDKELDQLIQRHGSSIKTYFLQGPASRFYASVQNREVMADFVMRQHPHWLGSALQEATRFCEHRMKLLAYDDVFLGRHIDWHHDPITGFQWPRRYWADFDLVHNHSADSKIIHELNRHQHLPRLAKAFFLSGDERYAFEAITQIESWIQQNPKWHGVNWHSSLEIAIRSVSWLWTIFLLLRSESLDEDKLRRICQSLFAQLDHIYRYPSVYTSPNTHLIGEASALFIAGVLFQELPRAEAWLEFGLSTLIHEIQNQVFKDGVYGERSSYYHCYATDFYLHVLALAQRNSISFPERVWGRFSRMLDFVMHITHSDGTIAQFGDDDGGRVLAIASQNYVSYRDGLCAGAVLLRRPDLKYQAGEFSEESLWLLGAESNATFDSLAARPPADNRQAFEDAGYFIQRSGWGTQDTQVTFDSGGLAIGSGGHSHADALSLTVFSHGHPFLIDPGTSVYNCAPDWRRFFRSTAAHSTVVIDNHGQGEPGDTFRWRTKEPGSLRKQVALPEFDYLDGDVTFRGITHRRRLIHVRPNYWIILDDLSGDGEHDFDFLYHFAPEARLSVLTDEKRGEIDCRARVEDTGLQLYMCASTAVRAEAVCGQNEPIQGWRSRLYGERRASPVLKASVHGVAPVAMMSFLVPGTEPLRARRFKANTDHAIAASIRDGECDDVVVMAVQDGDLRLTDLDMRGEFFWLRTELGRLRRLFAVNAYSFSYGGETLFESPKAIPYVQAYFWDDGIVIERGENEGKVYVRDLRDRQFQRN